VHHSEGSSGNHLHHCIVYRLPDCPGRRFPESLVRSPAGHPVRSGAGYDPGYVPNNLTGNPPRYLAGHIDRYPAGHLSGHPGDNEASQWSRNPRVKGSSGGQQAIQKLESSNQNAEAPSRFGPNDPRGLASDGARKSPLTSGETLVVFSY
jgi:hypothetical protein